MDKFNLSAFVRDGIDTMKKDTAKSLDEFLGIALIAFAKKLIPVLEELGTNPKDIAIFKRWVKNSTK